MSVLVPRPAIAARWSGALELRLRRAPLEVFLRSRSLPWAIGGPAQVTDNLTTAIVAIVSTGLTVYAGNQRRPLNECQLEDLAQFTCAVSEGLAALINEPRSWRIAALVSAAQVLRAHIGLSGAAHMSAGVARTYAASPNERSALFDIRNLAARTVERNDDEDLQTTSEIIAHRLAEREGSAYCTQLAASH